MAAIEATKVPIVPIKSPWPLQQIHLSLSPHLLPIIPIILDTAIRFNNIIVDTTKAIIVKIIIPGIAPWAKNIVTIVAIANAITTPAISKILGPHFLHSIPNSPLSYYIGILNTYLLYNIKK